jgi:hypothetical protein
MLIKMAIALVLAVGTTSVWAQAGYSNAFAAPNEASVAAKKKRSANPAHNVYDTTGQLLGSDPDPHVRDMIARDRES